MRWSTNTITCGGGGWLLLSFAGIIDAFVVQPPLIASRFHHHHQQQHPHHEDHLLFYRRIKIYQEQQQMTSGVGQPYSDETTVNKNSKNNNHEETTTTTTTTSKIKMEELEFMYRFVAVEDPEWFQEFVVSTVSLEGGEEEGEGDDATWVVGAHVIQEFQQQQRQGQLLFHNNVSSSSFSSSFSENYHDLQFRDESIIDDTTTTTTPAVSEISSETTTTNEQVSTNNNTKGSIMTTATIAQDDGKGVEPSAPTMTEADDEPTMEDGIIIPPAKDDDMLGSAAAAAVNETMATTTTSLETKNSKQNDNQQQQQEKGGGGFFEQIMMNVGGRNPKPSFAGQNNTTNLPFMSVTTWEQGSGDSSRNENDSVISSSLSSSSTDEKETKFNPPPFPNVAATESSKEDNGTTTTDSSSSLGIQKEEEDSSAVVVYRLPSPSSSYQQTPLSTVQKLGYSRDEIQSLDPEALSSILSNQVRRPQRGLPPRWKITSTSTSIQQRRNEQQPPPNLVQIMSQSEAVQFLEEKNKNNNPQANDDRPSKNSRRTNEATRHSQATVGGMDKDDRTSDSTKYVVYKKGSTYKTILFDKVQDLGYHEKDVTSLRPSALEIILMDQVRKPKSGLPVRWTTAVQKNNKDTIDNNATGNIEKNTIQIMNAPQTAEFLKNHATTQNNKSSDGLPSSGRGGVGNRATADREPTSSNNTGMRRKERMPRSSLRADGREKPIFTGRQPPDRLERQQRNQRRGATAGASADPPPPSFLWPDLETFRNLLRQEAQLRVAVVGEDLSGLVKQECDWRLQLYQDWLWVLHDGVGNPIVESRSDRARRRQRQEQQQQPRGRKDADTTTTKTTTTVGNRPRRDSRKTNRLVGSNPRDGKRRRRDIL